MNIIRSRVLASMAAVLACVGMSAVTASADQTGAAVFVGNTTQLTPVLTVGGTGTYAFSSTASSPQGIPGACVGAGVVTTPQVAAGTCVITAPTPLAAPNTYVNIVCGTGTTGGGPTVASDTATISSFLVNSGGATSLNTNYGIVFVAGLGILGGLQHTNSSVAVVGVVQITPTGGSCTSAVTNFTATGISILTP